VVVGGWLVQARVPPKIAKIRLRIIRVLHINSVLYRMGRLRSPYDPSLGLTVRRILISSQTAFLGFVKVKMRESLRTRTFD